ncbi:MAG: hypothetical protein R3D71_06530 [Rickettsiales bacterium]
MAAEQKYPLIQINSMKTDDEYNKLINDPNGDFQKYNEDFIKKNPNAVEILEKLDSGEPQHIPLYKIKELGSGAYNLWLEITVADSRGDPIKLDSTEFMAWQREAPDKSVDKWAEDRGVSIISQKETYAAGDQKINIETPEGARRAVTFRGIISEPREANYGEIVIDGTNGKPVNNGDGLPDIYVTEKVLTQIKSGIPYQDRVIVMDQVHDGGQFDEVKFYFGADKNNPKTDEQLIANFSRTQASSFTDKEYFHNGSEGKYTAMSYAQYQAWTYDVAQNPENASIAFTDWVDKKWGNKERFDQLFAGKATLSKEEYAVINSQSALKQSEDKIYSGTEFKELLERAGLGNFADAKKILADGMSVADLNGNSRMDDSDLFRLTPNAVTILQKKAEERGAR